MRVTLTAKMEAREGPRITFSSDKYHEMVAGEFHVAGGTVMEFQ